MADGEALRLALRIRCPMVHSACKSLDFRGKRAAQCHVQLLKSPADRQYRNAFFDGRADERQRCGVAGIIVRLERFARLHTIKRGVHIRSRAGDEQAVHGIENSVEIHLVAETWHQKRRYLCNLDGCGQILLGRGMPDIVFKRLYVGWHGNQRTGRLLDIWIHRPGL
ncbi:hypothetical protein P040_00319 [Brucella melitensis 11-1823-3434]|nr:hypothetical protein C056_02385 [Brucella melitensis F3/02]ENR00936.1 hypothetical protein C046_02332 [Brucella melitensis UK22/06]ENS58444.1 hypothetical protein B970_02156 [Brucella melitensis F10/06-16]ENS73846.1 hypothetical protein C059_03066 [Brucella melitensis UK23/06]ERT94472.1 hypothetical protein P040_00319 [Brucella melitensis 11-1823-3434]SUW51319.1 Uncharacterised protein [Brucella melitensis]